MPRQAAIIFNLGVNNLMVGLQEQRKKPEHIEPETLFLSHGKNNSLTFLSVNSHSRERAEGNNSEYLADCSALRMHGNLLLIPAAHTFSSDHKILKMT